MGLKDNFNNLIKHISDKLVNSKRKDKYKDFTNDLFSHEVLNFYDYKEIDNEMNKQRII